MASGIYQDSISASGRLQTLAIEPPYNKAIEILLEGSSKSLFDGRLPLPALEIVEYRALWGAVFGLAWPHFSTGGFLQTRWILAR